MAAERWNPNDQITAEHLNAMIDDTTAAMSTASNIAATASNAQTQAQQAVTTVSGFSSDIARAQNTANNAKEKADSNETRITELRTDLTSEITARQTADANFNAYATEIRTARNGETTLNDRITKISSSVSNTETVINDITGVLGNGNSLKTNLNSFVGAANAVNDAALGYASLDGRLDQIDQKITTAETNANTYTNTAIQDKLNTIITATQFDNLARRVSGIDGGALDESATKTHAQRLSALENEVINNPVVGTSNIKSNVAALVLEVNNAHRAVEEGEDEDTLAARFTAIEERLSDLDGGESGAGAESLTEIVNAIRAELTAAHREVESGQEPDTLVKRFEDIEANIVIIANELGMLNGAAIQDTNSRLDTLADKVNNETTGLDAVNTKVNTATENIGTLNSALATSNQNLTSLTTRVTTLENNPASATKIINNPIYNEETGLPMNIGETPSENVDYLLKKGDKYYYWKYINNVWELISGGGGSGSSSAEIYETLAEITSPSSTVDYFIGNATDGYTHYRYISQDGGSLWEMMLPKSLINSIGVTENGGLTATSLRNSNNLLNSFIALKTVNVTTQYQEDGITPKSYTITFIDTNGQTHEWDLAAGGSGGGTIYSVRFINDSGMSGFIVPNNSTNRTVLRAHVYARQGSEIIADTANIRVEYKLHSSNEYINIPSKAKNNVANNTTFEVDVTDLIDEENINVDIRLVATMTLEGETYERNLVYNIQRVPMAIEAINFNQAAIRTGAAFNFQYHCTGTGLSKIVTFKLDDVETQVDVGTADASDTLTQRISLSGLETRGMHTFQVYFTAEGVKSNVLNYYLLYENEVGSLVPMIAFAPDSAEITDGDEFIINYTVSTSNLESTDEVDLIAYTMNEDNEQVIWDQQSFVNVGNRVVQHYTIKQYPSSGEIQIAMTAAHTFDGVRYSDTKEITVPIKEYISNYKLEYAGTNSLLYAYSAYGKTNNDADRALYSYTYTDVDSNTVTFNGISTGFNWATNGYIGDGALTISGDAKHTVDLPILSSTAKSVNLEMNSGINDIRTNGRTIEIDYEVESATDPSKVIMQCADENNTGFTITPQACYFVKRGTNVNIDSSGLIHSEDSIAAAYLSTGIRTHLTFVIEPASNVGVGPSKSEYHQCVNIYINGEFANSCPYDKVNDTFGSTATLTIGDPTCIIKLYSIRMYNSGLSTKDVLNNYEMAPSTKRAQEARFKDNDILNISGSVDYEAAKKRYNCLLITGEISPYKKSTKTPSGLTLTKATENGEYTTEFELLDNTGETYTGDDNNTYLKYYSSNNVQGTSSQTYPLHNLKIYLAKEETTTKVDETTGEETQVVGSKKVKYSLKGANGIAESTLCWKADYMSTDHANTFNANLANDLFEDKLPSQVADSKVQNTVYGIRCLLFQRKDINSPIIFIGDGCLNNDKGNNKAFGLEVSTDSGNNTTRQKWEFTNNSDTLCFFQNDGLFAVIDDGDGKSHLSATDAFESTYPDEGDLEKLSPAQIPNYNHFQILLSWVTQRANFWDASDTVSGTTYEYNGETYDNEKAYRRAIFLNEFTRHFNLNHVLTYYLFAEFIALCDNRAKNMFMRCDNVLNETILNINGDTIFEGNSNPNADFFKTMTTKTITVTNTDGTEKEVTKAFMANANQIDWENSTFAVWAPVLYDLDSCFGVENIGKIELAYDAEWDYKYEGRPRHSGAESRFWLMVENAFASEIDTLAKTLYTRPTGLNYRTIYQQQLIGNNNATCPALINQDMLLKFDQFWADGFIDYSIESHPHVYRDYKYLQRGTRFLQKDNFMKKRANYLSSKYATANFFNDQIRFRNQENLDADDTGITLTVNQTLYPGVTYGDNKPSVRTRKVEAGESITVKASAGINNSDTIHIGGASALTDIGDISKFNPYDMDVAGGINLKRLIIGTSSRNNTINAIGSLNACTLLEEIDVTNCSNLSALNLSSNGLIKKVYSYGCNISPTLPNGGVLDTLYLSSAAENITILNQSFFTTFSYQDSATNNYGNVTRLWVENTPNVPIVEIVTKAMQHLTNGIRLIGINEDLNGDNTFLELLDSDYAKGKYLSGSGAVDNTGTLDPIVTGTIRTTEIKQHLLDDLATRYPDLTIEYTNIISEYHIEYEDWDGSYIWDTYVIENAIIPDPVLDINELTGSAYIDIPERAADARSTYVFGAYDYYTNEYVRYSGWRYKNTGDALETEPRANGSIVLVAYYEATPRTYTVSWYDEENGTLLRAIPNVQYGYNLGALNPPTRGTSFNTQKISGNVYKVFKGWNRSVGTVTGDINIYGLWEESRVDMSSNSYTINALSDLSAADLYQLASRPAAVRNRLLPDHLSEDYSITMGHDYDYSNVPKTNLVADRNQFYFNGAVSGVYAFNSIKPLEEDKDFTLAIDFKFLMSNYSTWSGSNEFVLVSCYDNNGSAINGFKVSLVKGSGTPYINVSWGTQDTTIDYVNVSGTSNDTFTFRSYRDIVVLRHIAGTNTLNVFYVSASNSGLGILGDSAISRQLSYSSNTQISTPLIFGGNYVSGTTNVENERTRRNAQGIIYWAKYWEGALDDYDCLQMASWPHETVTFKLSGYNNGKESTDSDTKQIIPDTNANLNFTAVQLMSDKYYDYSQSNFFADSNSGGWSNSAIRTFCNDRLYKGFPIRYQSLFKQTRVPSLLRTRVSSTNVTTDLRITDDYLYMPSYYELSSNVSSDPNYNQEAIHTLPWFDTDNIGDVYLIESNNATQQNTKEINYLRYRYFGHATDYSTARIFISQSNPFGTTYYVNNVSVSVQSGDIWHRLDESNNPVATYIYVNANEVLEGAPIDVSDDCKCAQGGWIPGQNWGTRTISTSNSTISANSMFRVTSLGSITVNTANASNPQYRGVSPEFSV